MLENDISTPVSVAPENEIADIVSDLVYTLFAVLDEYVTLLPNEDYSGTLTRMCTYLDVVMRKYIKELYNVDLEPTDYDYMLKS